MPTDIAHARHNTADKTLSTVRQGPPLRDGGQSLRRRCWTLLSWPLLLLDGAALRHGRDRISRPSRHPTAECAFDVLLTGSGLN